MERILVKTILTNRSDLFKLLPKTDRLLLDLQHARENRKELTEQRIVRLLCTIYLQQGKEGDAAALLQRYGLNEEAKKVGIEIFKRDMNDKEYVSAANIASAYGLKEEMNKAIGMEIEKEIRSANYGIVDDIVKKYNPAADTVKNAAKKVFADEVVGLTVNRIYPEAGNIISEYNFSEKDIRDGLVEAAVRLVVERSEMFEKMLGINHEGRVYRLEKTDRETAIYEGLKRVMGKDHAEGVVRFANEYASRYFSTGTIETAAVEVFKEKREKGEHVTAAKIANKYLRGEILTKYGPGITKDDMADTAIKAVKDSVKKGDFQTALEIAKMYEFSQMEMELNQISGALKSPL